MCVVRPRREDPTMYCNSLEPFIGYDGSITIKAGVHFLVRTTAHAQPHTHAKHSSPLAGLQLFGGSVVNLGTERHQKWYDATNNLTEVSRVAHPSCDARP